MPPTRGHDLKHETLKPHRKAETDAPHTGARLETFMGLPPLQKEKGMPPTRGHDLKPCTATATAAIWPRMPPTRGHDLKPA